jgi:hypothetical protein
MAVKSSRGEWLCGYCGAPYTDATQADVCRDSHNLIYVAFTSQDLNSLLHFVYSGDEQYLTDSLMNTLQIYLKGNDGT